MIGYFGNNILPFRLGELLRTYIVAKDNYLSKGFVFGTVVIERLLDTVTLLLLSFIMILVAPLDSIIRESILKFGLTFIIIILLLYPYLQPYL